VPRRAGVTLKFTPLASVSPRLIVTVAGFAGP
jgi:hypothetical protein